MTMIINNSMVTNAARMRTVPATRWTNRQLVRIAQADTVRIGAPPPGERLHESVYWKIPFWLRAGLLGGAVVYCTSVVLRTIGLGDPSIDSISELARILTFGASAGLAMYFFVLAERRHRLSRSERHKHDRADASFDG
jgi:hypothetical protein